MRWVGGVTHSNFLHMRISLKYDFLSLKYKFITQKKSLRFLIILLWIKTIVFFCRVVSCRVVSCRTSVAKLSLFFSPPDSVLLLPMQPMRVSAFLLSPSCCSNSVTWRWRSAALVRRSSRRRACNKPHLRHGTRPTTQKTSRGLLKARHWEWILLIEDAFF